jgi:hypothetical protein
MIRRMVSFSPATTSTSLWSPRLPAGALSRGREISESDAAFAAGMALKSLDDLMSVDLPWLGCWHYRLALKSVTVVAKNARPRRGGKRAA